MSSEAFGAYLGLIMSRVDQIGSVFLPRLVSDPSNARQWRMRAEEMRTLSDSMQKGTSRDMARRLADKYDRQARAEDERVQRAKPRPS
jgi:hypothetical protein